MNEIDAVYEAFGPIAEAGVDLHQIFAFSEMDEEGIPMYMWVEGMDEPLFVGKLPFETCHKIKILTNDSEAQAVLGLDQIRPPVLDETENDNLVDLNTYRE